jgi:hypothetical protein
LSLSLAPYAQIVQQLLDEHSSMSTNRDGVNVFLVRGEDFSDFGFQLIRQATKSERFTIIPRFRSNLAELARELNLGIDAFAFVDDSPFEANETASELLPDVQLWTKEMHQVSTRICGDVARRLGYAL